LQGQFGFPARLATNYDAALLSALVDAQAKQAIPRRESLCPLRSPLRLAVDDPTSPPVRFAAGIALLIAAAKLWDHAQDGEGLPRVLLPATGRLARNRLALAESRLASLGFDARPVRRQLEAQAGVESHLGLAFSEYSRPTELAVGAVFAHTAVLALQPANYDPLYEIGRSFGRIMLLLDSVLDYDSDAQQGGFNALAAAFPGNGWQGQAQNVFRQALSSLRHSYSTLDLPNPGVLPSLLLTGLGRAGCHSLGMCSARTAPARFDGDFQGDPSGERRDPFPEDRRLCSCGSCGRGCGDSSHTCGFHYCPSDCHCPGGECSGCDGCSCGVCGEGGVCDGCNDCNCPDCNNCCGNCDCSGCDCGDCDCGDCDCSGCDCSGCGDCGGCDCNC
jgi:hypothetical protein